MTQLPMTNVLIAFQIVYSLMCMLYFQYSGWNADNRENYYPVTEILDKNPKTTEKQPCVAIDLAELIKVKDKI